MTTQKLLDRLLTQIQGLTELYREVADELPNLRIVVDNTCKEKFKNGCKIIQFPRLKEEGENTGNKNTMQKPAIRLTKKEFKKLPKELQNKITINLTFPVRQKPNGVYEVRYRAHGFNVAVSSKDKSKLKPKFIAALCQGVPAELHAPVTERSLPKFTDICDVGLNFDDRRLKRRRIIITFNFSARIFFRGFQNVSLPA